MSLEVGSGGDKLPGKKKLRDRPPQMCGFAARMRTHLGVGCGEGTCRQESTCTATKSFLAVAGS